MSVLLDTNVVSELIRKAPDPGVAAWVANLPLEDLYFTAVGEAELRFGAALLPAGRRRANLMADIEGMLQRGVPGSVCCRSTERRRASMRTWRRRGVVPVAMSRSPTARSQRSPVRGA